jgi:hypothetical protein
MDRVSAAVQSKFGAGAGRRHGTPMGVCDLGAIDRVISGIRAHPLPAASLVAEDVNAARNESLTSEVTIVGSFGSKFVTLDGESTRVRPQRLRGSEAQRLRDSETRTGA